MDSEEIRKKFLAFFEKRGHVVVPSSSLVPANDPSVLFTSAGMQQFKPYYESKANAQADFGSVNVVSIQKCVRTSDIDEVGDDTHLTFFEMLGNFSFGGYWKKEAIEYAYEFITKELGLTIDYVSVFRDDASGIPADEESRTIWTKINPNLVIKDHNRENNFWGPTGHEGPCGPTTEVYVNGVEIWNIVFNEFYQKIDKTLDPLRIKGIDTGMGLERLAVAVQKKSNVFETDLFEPLLTVLTGELSEKDKRIIIDHIRAASFMISDGVKPANKESGYVLRRLMRTVASYQGVDIQKVLEVIVKKYRTQYPELDQTLIVSEFSNEKDAYQRAYEKTKTEIQKFQGGLMTGQDVFDISSTLGAKVSDIVKIAEETKIEIVEHYMEGFDKASREHQKLSRTSSVGMFKGGLANQNEQTVKLHTTHHLLLAALQRVLGNEVKQRGSNITEERLRIDFAFPRKLTDEEKKKVEDIVNSWIKADHSVVRREMPRIEAETFGAEMEFGAKYPDIVSIYMIEDKEGNVISKEFCGGPHVERTGELASLRDPEGYPRGNFRIIKEEASSAGVRRIKAVLQ